MKKYNTPVIEALALEAVDVICTSGNDAGLKALGDSYAAANKTINSQEEISAFVDTWNW